MTANTTLDWKIRNSDVASVDTNSLHLVWGCGWWNSGRILAVKPDGSGFELDPNHCIVTLDKPSPLIVYYEGNGKPAHWPNPQVAQTRGLDQLIVIGYYFKQLSIRLVHKWQQQIIYCILNRANSLLNVSCTKTYPTSLYGTHVSSNADLKWCSIVWGQSWVVA